MERGRQQNDRSLAGGWDGRVAVYAAVVAVSGARAGAQIRPRPPNLGTTQRLDPCSCIVLSQRNSACVAGVHAPAKLVRGRHVVGAVVL